MDDSNTLIADCGAEIKALGGGKIAGYAVRFGTPDDADLTGDYFDASTDFGDHEKVALYFDHGLDRTLKARKIGSGSLKTDEVGLWYEAQMSLRDEYEKAVYQLAEEGKLGFSTGAAAHLVTREATGKAMHIKSWPIGEVSATPRPAEPRNRVDIKSLAAIRAAQELGDPAQASNAPESEAEATATVAPSEVAAKATTEAANAVIIPEPITNTPMENNENKAEARVPEASDTVAQVKAMLDEFKATMQPTQPIKVEGTYEVKKAPAVIPTRRADNEKNAFAHWMRTGDTGGVKHMIVDHDNRNPVVEVKASNATDMNITTAADGGNTVTDEMFPGIIARRDEMLLASKLGVRRFTGSATTLDVPKDNEADGEFVTKAEATAFDQDSPAIGQTVLTLVKYTKYFDISDELLRDSSANVLDFTAEWVSRGLAKTHNNLLITEAVANGTNLTTTASTTALALGELEATVYNEDLSNYLDDGGSVGWAMRGATFGKIISLGGTSNRYYADTAQGTHPGRELLGYPVHFSSKIDAYGTANNRFAHFANWFHYMGLYEDGALQFVRDPFTVAINGQVRMIWKFRCDYGVLQAEAGGFVRHITT